MMKIIVILFMLILMSCSELAAIPADSRYYTYYSDDYSELLQEGSPYLEKAEADIGKDLLPFWDDRDTINSETEFLIKKARQYSNWKIKSYVNILNKELLKKIHESLENGLPVPIEFAKGKDYMFVTSMDLGNDEIVLKDIYDRPKAIYTVKDFIYKWNDRKIEDETGISIIYIL